MAFRTKVKTAALVWVVALSGMLVSCNPSADDNRSTVLPVVVAVTSDDGDYLNSDVLEGGSVIEDAITIQARSIVKNVTAESPHALSTAVFTEAHITYVRADGLNEPGVHVPFPLFHSINFSIEPDSTGSLGIIVITAIQKTLPPLRNLWFLGGEKQIEATAIIDLRGADLSGNALQMTGRIQIFFADFAD